MGHDYRLDAGSLTSVYTSHIAFRHLKHMLRVSISTSKVIQDSTDYHGHMYSYVWL